MFLVLSQTSKFYICELDLVAIYAVRLFGQFSLDSFFGQFSTNVATLYCYCLVLSLEGIGQIIREIY